MSEYENLREQRIKQNAAKLEELGLGHDLHPLRNGYLKVGSTSRRTSTGKRARESSVAEASTARIHKRVSPRLAGQVKTQHLTKTVDLQTNRTESLPSYISSAFSAHAEASIAVDDEVRVCRWDRRKHHQHLTLSPSRLTAATTGCAGYGACLAEKAVGVRWWEVRCVSLGVGGFAVGLTSAKCKGPFKSLGNSAECFGVYHSSGSLFCNRAEQIDFASSYGSGDCVGILIRPNNDVVFYLNGVQVGEPAFNISVVSKRKSNADDVVLACQPYMGGVALIVTASKKMNRT
jgi:hypothetical protein